LVVVPCTEPSASKSPRRKARQKSEALLERRRDGLAPGPSEARRDALDLAQRQPVFAASGDGPAREVAAVRQRLGVRARRA
jgi:hypothetical protein